ncbi:hypothetical protein F4779DRAFT_317158 [Xylariaceae sp. FL0662B]|nr:hypothetical protein F4779DRAFT_317158 [Xylariaceae sp. FL0662B]
MTLGRWNHGSGGKPSIASSGANTNGTTTPSGSESRDSTKSQTGLLRSLAGSFKSHRAEMARKSAERREFRNRSAQLNKPLTRQNLEHQKVLKEFSWDVNKRRMTQSRRSSFSGISPTGSRRVSIDHDYPPPPSDSKETHPWFSSSLGHDSSNDVSSDESDKEHLSRELDFPSASHIETV